jgi:hypothetical protein
MMNDLNKSDCVVAGVDMQVSFTYEAPSGINAIYGEVGLYEIHSVELNGVDLILVLNEETIQAIEDQLDDQRNCNFDY